MTMQLRVLDLFSGIGGFSLGLERTGGFRTVAFCECEPYCRAVLAKHWPAVLCYDDVRTLTANRIFQNSHGELPDVICGGFPCQDVSLAGFRAGIDADRSGLWKEFARLIREIRPRYAIVENTPGLLSLGMDRVLGDLAEIGYDAEWHCIPAAAIGAPHQRDRVWIVTYPDGCQLRTSGTDKTKAKTANLLEHGAIEAAWLEGWREIVADVGSAVYGVSGVVDRLRPFGNAVVPQIPEIIGRAILRAIDGQN